MCYMVPCATWCHVLHGAMCYMVPCATWCHVLYGAMCYMVPCAIWCHVLYGAMCYMVPCAIWCHVLHGAMCYMVPYPFLAFSAMPSSHNDLPFPAATHLPASAFFPLHATLILSPSRRYVLTLPNPDSDTNSTPLQLATARYSALQLSTAHYSPVQPSTSWGCQYCGYHYLINRDTPCWDQAGANRPAL